MNALKIITGFDGACPFSDAGVTENNDGSFEIRPFWRPEPGISEEAVGAGSRFSVKVENRSNSEQTFRCYINWQDEQRKRLRFHDWVAVLFPDAGDWVMRAAELDASGARISIPLPPGTTHIGMSPYYSYGMAVDYLKSKAGKYGAVFRSIGGSGEGREIPLLLIDSPEGGKNKTDFLYMGRNHAYESAGSFCAEGMIDFLLSENPQAKYFRSEYRFHFLPMTNPDGVFNGMSRLTAPRGADLNRVYPQADAAWQSLKNYVDAVKPELLLNIHNWMDKEKDGLLTNTLQDAEEFRKLAPDMIEDKHYWLMEWTDLYLRKHGFKTCPEQCKSWKDYTLEKFGTQAITLEFPWYNRNTARMREIGRQALEAFLKMEVLSKVS